MVPTTRQQFSQFIMRKLGAPVLQINISEEQADDIIDQALWYFAQNHYLGAQKTYYAYSLQQSDIDNAAASPNGLWYIQMPQNVIGGIRIFPIGQAISSDALFNMRYQFIMNDLYSLTNVSLVPYYMTMQHIALLEEILVGQQPIRYNRHENKLWLDMDWTNVVAGEVIMVEAFYALGVNTTIQGQMAGNVLTVSSGLVQVNQTITGNNVPANTTLTAPLGNNQFTTSTSATTALETMTVQQSVPDLWSDRWLQDYSTALMKRQWGTNITLYDSIMPSGIKLNGEKIYNDADKEVRRLEDTLIRDFGAPLAVFMA